MEESKTSRVDTLNQQVAETRPPITQPPSEPRGPSFHPFVRLPTELRLKIWSYCHPGPRGLRISCQKIRLWPSMPKLYAESFKCNLPPPQTLHVCSESRAEALEIYKPLFRTKRSDCQIFVCFERDTIFMADNDLAYVGTQEMNGIQRLKIRVIDYMNFGRYHIQTIKDMRSLLEVDVVVDETWSSTVASQRNISKLLQLEFTDEMADDPTWNCPRINTVGSDTGMNMGTLRGGTWMPNWKSGDPRPSPDAVQEYWAFQTGVSDLSI